MPTDIELLGPAFKTYLQACYGTNLKSFAQYCEVKQAFYSGASIAIAMCMEATTLPEDKSVEVLECLNAELKAYHSNRVAKPS
jgi:hypothetical protein